MDRNKRIFLIEQQQPVPDIPLTVPNIVELLEEDPINGMTGPEVWKKFAEEYNECQRRIQDFIYRIEIRVRKTLNQNYDKWDSFNLSREDI